MKQYSKIVIERKGASAVRNIPCRVPVYRNFNEHDLVGYAEVYERNGELVADLMISDDKASKIELLYPAIGGIKNNESLLLKSIGVSVRPNQDPTIKSIEAQTYA